MNKKFSTLFTLAAFATAFAVNAQTPVEPGWTDFETTGEHRAIVQDGKLEKKLKTGANEALYQIAVDRDADGKTTNMVLSMKDDGTVEVVDVTDLGRSDAKDLARTLWCVTVSTDNQGQAPKYDFMNKATGLYLDLTMADKGDLPLLEQSDPIVVGGEIGGWAFSDTYAKSLEESKPLYSYYTRDYVVGLAIQDKDLDTDVAVGDKVVAVKRNAQDAATAKEFDRFSLRTANQFVLTSDELNTILGNQDRNKGVSLKFTPDIKGTTLKNPFNMDKFISEESDIPGYLYVRNMDKSGYLKVDTAYTNDKGVRFLAYGWTGKGENTTAEYEAKNSKIKDQHKFKFIYDPSFDRLYIYVRDVTMNPKDPKRYWDGLSSVKNADFRVSLQDLIKDEVRILTVDSLEQNTVINLGFGGCSLTATTKSSIEDGVYFIKNAKGQYLASPIYENGEVNAHFVTVNAEEQSPAHMPAYQWVVLKKYTQAQVRATSPVTITNREFVELEDVDVQLYKNEGASRFYVKANGSDLDIASSDSLYFEAVPAASKSDSLLGYKKLTKEELMINKYLFNYWHPYAQDKFIGKSSHDSTLTVLNERSAFVIDTIASEVLNKTVDIPYGFKVTPAIQKRIAGLKQLYRTAYEISLDGKKWYYDIEKKFNVSKYNNDKDLYFFFKENNHFGDQHYYAIVEASYDSDPFGELVIRTADNSKNRDNVVKAGVSDYDGDATLKKQLLNETRTSAFAIYPDETPLYRRFNSEKLEGHAGDGVDTLRFYEKYRKEFLMIENNEHFMQPGIDFLGIYTPDKANAGLAFQVDTAWLNRGAGHIKPQYLISIDRHDFEGVAGEPCTESGPHIDESGHITDDPYQCVHAHKAVPGFKRGKFLINFHNFTNSSDKVNADKYKWAGYDRAGFKEAIVYKDTLYILRDEFKNLASEKINFDAIKKAEADAKVAHGTKFVPHIYSLLTDCHKYVTWSMRFYDRKVAANEVEADRAFLFESMNESKNADVQQWIAPKYAAWLKMQNGCLVLSDPAESNFDEVTGGDDALIFNVEYVLGDEVAVDNENIAVEGVSVVAGNGQVTIMGAAGKNVTITNILGKVIANQTIASDNATIAVPAGIVAVAVEGEAAVKAIVK